MGAKRPVTELDLVRRAKGGDEAAMTELLSVHSQQAYRLALHILRNRADAEDATQNALVKAFTELNRFQQRSSFATWLLRIVTREALNLRRAETTRFAFWQRHQAFEESEATVEAAVMERAEYEDLWRGLHRLKTDDRLVLVLTYFMDLSEADVAATLGIKRGAVKKRKHSARARLRALVERDFREADYTAPGRPEPEGASR